MCGGCVQFLCERFVRAGVVGACALQRGMVVRGDCAQGYALRLCAHCALCALRVPSLVRFERLKAFALFTTALLAWHKAFDPCAKCISFNFYSVQRLAQVSLFKHRISCTPKAHFVPICAHSIQRTNGVSSMSSNATFNSRVPLVASRSLFFANATRLSQKCANRVDLENAALSIFT